MVPGLMWTALPYMSEAASVPQFRGAEDMMDKPTWKVYYGAETKPVRCRPDNLTREDALQRACPLWTQFDVLYIEGPNNELIEREKIIEWCSRSK
jgi:hypothetical protein